MTQASISIPLLTINFPADYIVISTASEHLLPLCHLYFCCFCCSLIGELDARIEARIGLKLLPFFARSTCTTTGAHCNATSLATSLVTKGLLE